MTPAGNRNIYESIVIDAIKTSRRDVSIPLGSLAEMGLASFNLYFTTYFTSSHLAEYLLVASHFQSDMRSLISESLRTLYQAQSGWGGNEVIAVCLVVSEIPLEKLYIYIPLLIPQSHYLSCYRFSAS